MEEKKNNTKGVIIGILIVILLCVIGVCVYLVINKINVTKKENETEKTVDVKKFQSEYRMSGNQIEDFDLFFLKEENKEKNMIYSPLSIKYALMMLNDAADGETKGQLDAVVGDYTAKKYDNNTNMSFANVLFVKDSLNNSVSSEYTNLLKEKYNANVEFDNFSNANNINNWISNNTLNLINNLVKDEDVKDANFVLLNALAINMDWEYQIQLRPNNSGHKGLLYNFRYYHTTYSDGVQPITAYLEDENFEKINFSNNKMEVPAAQIGATINKYDIVNVLGEDNIKDTVGKEYEKNPICYSSKEEAQDRYIEEINEHYKDVKKSTDFEFYVDDDVKVFAKDLKKYNNTTLQYIGIMPKKDQLSTYINNLDAKKLNDLVNSLITIDEKNFEDGYVYKISGYIPFFKYEYDLNLKEDLQKLGIKDVFDSKKSNLYKLISDTTYIEKTEHKANIEFTNEGITAAAVFGSGGFGATGCDLYSYDLPVKEIDLTFDNPYMYIIRDKDSGEIWFVGTVYEPNPDAK